jgi:hypothetical protein
MDWYRVATPGGKSVKAGLTPEAAGAEADRRDPYGSITGWVRLGNVGRHVDDRRRSFDPTLRPR